eukprot:5829875-Pleurochrysis_carterae.AAC.1
MQLHSCGHRSNAASPGAICRVTAPRQLFHGDVEMLKGDFRPFPILRDMDDANQWLSTETLGS